MEDPSLGRRDMATQNQTKSNSTLSRNALYAPLIAYEQTEVEPTSFMANRSGAVPKEIKESTLNSFLRRISVDYHRNHASGADPKNNGSRPTSLSDIQERIRQRAVTLVGGGVNSSISTRHSAQTKRKAHKRKRKDWEQVKGLLQKSTMSNASPPSTMESVSFLRKLNSAWNEYIASLLEIDGKGEVREAFTIRNSLTAEKVSMMELVGAHVRIASCIQKQGLVGRLGTVIGESKNTWRVAFSIKKRQNGRGGKQMLQSEHDAHDSSSTHDIHPIKAIIVPKRGSTIEVLISLNGGSSVATKTTIDIHRINMSEDKFVVVTLKPDADT